MTQQIVYNVLKKHRKWMTSKEIAKILGTGNNCVCVSLSKLKKQGEILSKGSGERSFFGKLRSPYLYKIK